MVTHLYVDGPYDGAELRGAHDTIEQTLRYRAIDLPAAPGPLISRPANPDAPPRPGHVRYVLHELEDVSCEETIGVYHHQPTRRATRPSPLAADFEDRQR
jgi:hypothetical protein